MSESVAANDKAIHWTEMLEEYFASTGEKAHCLSWCHKRAEQLYSTRRTWIDLPVIVISGVTGFLSAGSTTLFDNPQMSSVALGVASLFVSVLNTAGSYYGWAKRAEGHRISAIHYARLYRSVSVELSLPREERTPPNEYLKYVKDQYDRLQEISPLLPPEVINEFQKKFANEKEISKPEEANGLEKITVFRGNENLDVSDPNESRSPQFKIRTPKISKVSTPEIKENPMYKAAQLAKRASPNILAAAAPAPPSILIPSNVSSSSSSVSEEEVTVEMEQPKTSS